MSTWIITLNLNDLVSVDYLVQSRINEILSLRPKAQVVQLSQKDYKLIQTHDAFNLINHYYNHPPDEIHLVHPTLIGHKVVNYILSHTNSHKIKFSIYELGDFIKRIEFHYELEPLMKGKSIHYYFPSLTYTQVASNFFSDKNNLSYLPVAHSPNSFLAFSLQMRNEIRKKFNLSNNDLLLIYAGRFHQQKNLLLLIDFFKQLKTSHSQAKLILIGNHEFQYNQVLDIASLENKDIHVLSHVSKKDLIGYYSAADFYLSLSTYHDESYGLAPVEALQTGLPLILSDWGGFKDLAFTYNFDESMIFYVKTLELEKNFTIDHETLPTLYDLDLMNHHDREIFNFKPNTKSLLNNSINNKVNFHSFIKLYPFKNSNHYIQVYKNMGST